MRVYESERGLVEKGVFSGFRFTIHGAPGRRKPTPFMKHLMGALHQELRTRGIDTFSNLRAAAAFWDFFLEMAGSPPNGLYHQAIATQSIAEICDGIVGQIGHGGK